MLITLAVAFVTGNFAYAEDASSKVLRTPMLNVNSVLVGQTTSEVVDEEHEAYFAKYIVPIMVAADEEFQNISYWVPWSTSGLNWHDAAVNIIERADNEIYKNYGIDFKIVGFTMWNSDNSLMFDEDRLEELAEELNWQPSIRGNIILVGFTAQEMYYNGVSTYGIAFNVSRDDRKVMLMQTKLYWADDNIFQHEISHLLGVNNDDCVAVDCVMSSLPVELKFWTEDSWIFAVFDTVDYSYISHHYCPHCEAIVLEGLKPYINTMQDRSSSGYGVRGILPLGVFPL